MLKVQLLSITLPTSMTAYKMTVLQRTLNRLESSLKVTQAEVATLRYGEGN